jgi:hypothetical protein
VLVGSSVPTGKSWVGFTATSVACPQLDVADTIASQIKNQKRGLFFIPNITTG